VTSCRLTSWELAIVLGIGAATITSFLATYAMSLRLNILSLSGALFILVALIATTRALYLRDSLLDPIYLAFYAYALFIGIGPLLDELIPPSALRESMEPTAWVAVMSWGGLAALAFGYRTITRKAVQSGEVVTAEAKERPDKRQVLLWGGIILTLVGIVGIAVFLVGNGGLSFLLDTAYGTREYPAFYVATSAMLRPGLFLLIAWALVGKRQSHALWVLLFAFMCFDLVWFGPLSGSRNQIITLVLTLVYLAKFIPGRTAIFGTRFLRGSWLIVVGLVLTLLWGGLRTYSVAELVSDSPANLNVFASAEVMAAESFYAPYEGFVGAIDLVPSKVPYGLGRTLLDSLTVVIPRAVWPSKHGSFGVWLSDTLYGAGLTANSVPTWPGELYFNFGWIGLILGMYATGVACARMAQSKSKERDGQPDVWCGLMAAVWFPLPFVWIWGGSNTAAWHILLNVMPIWVVFQVSGFLRGLFATVE